MTILHLVQYSLPEIRSGYTLRTHAIASAQQALGLDPIILTSPRHPSAEGVTIDGIPYLRCQPERKARSPWLRDLRRIRALAARSLAVAREREFRLLHAHSPVLCGLAAVRAGRRLGRPVVYEVRGVWEEAIGSHLHPRYLLARSLELRVCRQVEAVVAISEGLRRDVVSRGAPADRVHVVPNGVDTEAFSPRPSSPEFRRALGLGEGPLVLYLGALREYEGIGVLLEAWPGIAARVPGAQLLVVGDGEAREKIAARVQALLSVRLLPPVPHEAVGDYYAAADLVVYPRLSTRATELVTPLKPLEAMATGKAVLASDVGGLRELLSDGETARLFPASAAAALAEACVELLGDEGLRRRLGENARQRVVAHHQWRQVAERYRELYDSLAPESGP